MVQSSFGQTTPQTQTLQQRRVQKLHHERKLLLLAPMPIQHMAKTTDRIDQEDAALMKIIGLISDTHIPSRASAIPQRVFEVFRDVSLIIHAGDLTQLKVIDELERLAPVIAVQGNMDSTEVKTKLPATNTVQVDNFKIGVVHNLGMLRAKGKTIDKAEKNTLSVLVFGHVHSPSIKKEHKVLLINPGSPTSPMLPFIIKPTVGLLKISEGKIEPEIVRIE